MKLYPILTAASCLLLGACATSPTPRLNIPIAVTPSRSLDIFLVRAADHDGGVQVNGRVMRSGARTPVWGHLHVEAFSKGRLIGWTDTRWTRLSKKRLPSSYFRARLPVPPGSIDEIHISHLDRAHPRTPASRQKP